jgi:hypothetical protein
MMEVSMPTIEWGDARSRVYQIGIDRGVLYVPSYPGVPWNGLVSVAEAPAGGTANEFFIDGQKYMGSATLEEYAATIESFSSPAGFAPCAGYFQMSPGLFATHQPRESFGFSYRTMIGDDVLGTNRGYKVHIVYNASAKTADFAKETINSGPNVKSRTWDITTVPVSVPSFRPTSHFVVDSTKIDPAILSVIEGILYGTVTDDPRLLTAQELSAMVGT